MTNRHADPSDRAAARRDAARRDGGATERIVAAVLLVIALLLGYVRFVVVPQRQPEAGTPPFDLRNPMLDARVGECVELEDSGHPGETSCSVVIEPGLVVRPTDGPEALPGNTRLRRMPPYLVTAARFPEPGKGGCATSEGKRDEIVLYDLNLFGMPMGIPAEVVQIQPMWKKWQGRVHYTYQVQMLRYGNLAGPWTSWISEDAPVTGVVHREYTYGSQQRHAQIIYREVDGCTPPR